MEDPSSAKVKNKIQKGKSRDNRSLLVEHVEEQSGFCDIRIKVGSWEKKFHRCVLIASPFLDLLMEYNDIKKDEGTFEIKIGRPNSVELAIMYLYGKKPKLSIDNVEGVLEMAEFFLLPNLKSFCYSWLKTAALTTENCMCLLMMSSFYGFEIQNCTDIIESHLPEIFQNDLSMHLTKESVKYILSESRFSYVRMDTRLQFLLKWLRFAPERREYTADLCGKIDFGEIAQTLVEQIRIESCMWNVIPLSHNVIEPQEESKQKVLIFMTEPSSTGVYICLDLESEKYSRLVTRPIVGLPNYADSREISGVRTSSEVYFHKQYCVTCVDLEANTIHTYNVVSGEDLSPSTILLEGNFCLCTVDTSFRYYSNICSTLNVGKILREDSIDITPLLTLRKNKISKLCLNRNSVLAMKIASKNYIFLYHLKTCKLEKIPLKKEFDQIEATDDGFVALDSTSAVFINISESVFQTTTRHYTYHIANLEFEHDPHSVVKYFFCDQKLFRCFTSKYERVIKFEYAPVDSIGTFMMPRKTAWKSIPLPNDSFLSRNLGDSLHVVELPKHKLRCDIACPHCEFLKHGFGEDKANDQGRDCYFDSSDDNEYEMPTVIKNGRSSIYLNAPDSDDLTTDDE